MAVSGSRSGLLYWGLGYDILAVPAYFLKNVFLKNIKIYNVKGLKFILTGILFGIVMSKSEAISWFRIQEMFRFQSFHMYGIMGSALVLGVVGIQAIKRYQIKAFGGREMQLAPKKKGVARYLVGGILFGLGWALVGTCPGPMYVLVGAGFYSIVVVLASAVLGTFVYGLLRNRLPH